MRLLIMIILFFFANVSNAQEGILPKNWDIPYRCKIKELRYKDSLWCYILTDSVKHFIPFTGDASDTTLSGKEIRSRKYSRGVLEKEEYYYSDGSLKKRAFYLGKDTRDYYFTEFSQYGQVVMLGEYKDNLKHGYWRIYNPKYANLEMSGFYEKGVKRDCWINWNALPKKSKTREFRKALEVWEEGKLIPWNLKDSIIGGFYRNPRRDKEDTISGLYLYSDSTYEEAHLSTTEKKRVYYDKGKWSFDTEYGFLKLVESWDEIADTTHFPVFHSLKKRGFVPAPEGPIKNVRSDLFRYVIRGERLYADPSSSSKGILKYQRIRNL